MGKEKGSRVFFEVYRKQMKEEKTSPQDSLFPPPEQTCPTDGRREPHPATEGALEDIEKVEVAIDTESSELRESEVRSQESRTQDLGLKTPHKVWQQRVGFKRDEVSIRQDTLIYAALGAVFLSLGCFFIGHKLGYDKGRKAELIGVETVKQISVGITKDKTPQPAVKKTEETQEVVSITPSQTSQKIQSQPIESKEEKWTLRIISYKIGDQNTKKASDLARTIQKEIGHDTFVAKTPQELVVCVGKFDNRDSSELLELQKELRDFKYENKMQFKSCYPVRLR